MKFNKDKDKGLNKWTRETTWKTLNPIKVRVSFIDDQSFLLSWFDL